jgi:hypothetical protein
MRLSLPHQRQIHIAGEPAIIGRHIARLQPRQLLAGQRHLAQRAGFQAGLPPGAIEHILALKQAQYTRTLGSHKLFRLSAALWLQSLPEPRWFFLGFPRQALTAPAWRRNRGFGLLAEPTSPVGFRAPSGFRPASTNRLKLGGRNDFAPGCNQYRRTLHMFLF